MDLTHGLISGSRKRILTEQSATEPGSKEGEEVEDFDKCHPLPIRAGLCRPSSGVKKRPASQSKRVVWGNLLVIWTQQLVVPSGGFAGRIDIADDIVFRVAGVSLIVEGTAGRGTLMSRDAIVAVGLIHGPDRRANIFQFLIDAESDFAQSDDQRQDADRGDQNQFGGNDETGVVIPKGDNCVQHGVLLVFLKRVWGGLDVGSGKVSGVGVLSLLINL